MSTTKRIGFMLSLGGIALYAATGFAAYAATDADPALRAVLESQIQQKASELQKINQELSETQKNLNETKAERTTLQKEISNIDKDIKQLNLKITADAVTIEKLKLETKSITYEVADIRTAIKGRKASIGLLLKEIQRRDNENLLVMFLKHKTLSDGVQAAQNLSDLNGQLGKDIKTLTALEDELTGKVDELSGKQAEIESRKKSAESKKQIVEEQRTGRQALVTQTKNKESVYERQLEELRKKQLEIAEEIEKFETELRKKIDPNLLPKERPGVLAWPVRGGRLSQEYGSTAFALVSYRGKHHNGVDIAAPLGTEILAAEKGVIINAGNQDRFCPRGAYGKFVVVKHENGLTTLYAHLSSYSAAIGQTVEKGSLLGYMGKTGYATGSHLHFTVFASNTLTPAREGFPEGASASRSCGPTPVGGDLDPFHYLEIPASAR